MFVISVYFTFSFYLVELISIGLMNINFYEEIENGVRECVHFDEMIT